MTTIIATVTDRQDALKFENVEYYYETRKGLEIVQEESYITSVTVIRKENLLRYSIIEKRV